MKILPLFQLRFGHHNSFRVFHESNVGIESYPAGIITEYRDGFGIAMNYSDKIYDMKLPDSSEVIFGNKSISQAGVLVWKY